MIYGIGTDLCDVRRIRASLEKHGDRFAQKVLSEAEFEAILGDVDKLVRPNG
ncbi:MAG: Holo-[acyl-carrier-protein] synthase [Pseudomonadota bacterium]